MNCSLSQSEKQISESIGAMVLLHSSNQALIEVSITPSSSPWYPILNAELGAVENLVVEWRQEGFLYFQQEILQQIVSCGEQFLSAQPQLEALYSNLERDFSSQLKQEIVDKLTLLQGPVRAMHSSLSAYLSKLGAYQSALATPEHNMLVTVTKIQEEATDIQGEIATINAEIANMKSQLIEDREAISKAKAAEHRGIIETIFGVLLAPITGGASLILAGIGVGTIAAAEEKLSQLQDNIATSQAKIVSDQGHLSDDEKQIATLHGLTMSVDLALSDISGVESALTSLRTSWSVLDGELVNEAENVARSVDAKSALLSKVWFDTACNDWSNIVMFAKSYSNATSPTPNRVSVG